MTMFIDLSGKTFRKLTVIERSKDNKHGQVMWVCVCSCGNTTIANGGNIRNGHTRSCGCLQNDNFKWTGDKATYNAVHIWLKKNKPKPEVCEMCRERLPAELSFNHKVGNWTRNIEDYQWLCTVCHKLKDAGNNAKPLTKARIHRIREFYKAGAGTHKKLGELSKTKPKLQEIFNQCFFAAISVASCAEKISPNKPAPDVGELSLNGLETLAQIEGIVLTGRKEINAEYMSKILNSYGKKDLK